MSKYDGLDDTEYRQLLLAKLEMLVRWTNGASRMGRFDDLETKQYHAALNDAAELVGLLNGSYHEARSNVDKVLSGQFSDKEITGLTQVTSLATKPEDYDRFNALQGTYKNY